MTVEEVMTTEVVTCRADDTLLRAARLLEEGGVSCMPVLEAGGGRRVVGVLSARDICLQAVARRTPLERLSAGRVMHRDVHWCWSGDSLEAAEAIMRAYGVRRLPVVTPAGELVGLVSLSDIACSVGQGRPGGEEAHPTDVVETLAAISRASP